MSGYGWNQCCNTQPTYCGNGGSGYGSTFVLIVVLFILLVIVGTSFI